MGTFRLFRGDLPDLLGAKPSVGVECALFVQEKSRDA
jgi:hypothetical protein